jgi:hypothetical protein
MTDDVDGSAILIVRDQVTVAALTAMAEGMFGDLAKAVVDLGRMVMALGGAMHADEEAGLISDGST